ncbi:hypothetical protein SADUNF_Sadunf10G0075500 [Salix dunnii]|uniref:glucan endo-1,3-beta-D-glucosidase n=1 Tax=Salix dunnii TaxID=1413687 RepID=A0A835JMQ0_9ROSI|nr:hypothetical protein SADUNF_Sadunf10G0075500 [Salix dunnii]
MYYSGVSPQMKDNDKVQISTKPADNVDIIAHDNPLIDTLDSLETSDELPANENIEEHQDREEYTSDSGCGSNGPEIVDNNQDILEMLTPKIAMWIMVLRVAAIHISMVLGESGDAGIIYGRNGDNLPSPKRVIDFLTEDMNYAISVVRVYDAIMEVLEAISGTNLIVTIGVPDEAIAHVASSQEAADKWFRDHVLTYVHKGVRFRYICVGYEAIPGVVQSLVLQAIINLYNSVRKANIDYYIYVTTAVGGKVLESSYPPSTGRFAHGVDKIMNNLTEYLYDIGSPLLINLYPYYALVSEPQHISLDYALFQSQKPVFIDGSLEYYNLFDAMVDAFVAAMARAVQQEDVKLVFAQTGWPTAGIGSYACTENA